VGFRYLLTGQIGGGGGSTIFSATDRGTKQRVAVKVMHPEMAVQETWRDSIMKEVALSRRISQTNMVKIHQGGVSEGGYVFLVMDLLEGETLAARLSTRGRLATEDACHVGVGVALALSGVHAAGHVHGDVKPENIFLCGPISPRGLNADTVRLMDLGVARPINAPATGTTVDGTPAYMSPEQVSGNSMDQRSDLYSLGVVLYEMLTGRPCFDAAGASEVMLAHILEPAPLLPESILATPAGKSVAELLASLLAKSPDCRPSCAHEVVAVLEGALAAKVPAMEGLDFLEECV